MQERRGHVLGIPAENDVDPIIERSVLLRDGIPGFSSHDHHILLACRSVRSVLFSSSTLPHTVHQLSVHASILVRSNLRYQTVAMVPLKFAE